MLAKFLRKTNWRFLMAMLVLMNILPSSILISAAPLVSSISPDNGPIAGGTSVTVNGTGFSADGGEVWGRQSVSTSSIISSSADTDSSGNVYISGQFSGSVTFGALGLTSVGSSDVFVVKYNSAGTPQWAKRGGGTGADIGFALTIDSSDNVYVTGSFSGTATFGALTSLVSTGNTDVFLVKYNSAGTEQWNKKGGSTGADIGRGLTTNAGGDIYVTGSFSNTIGFGALGALVSTGNTDVFLVKYNSAGTEQWNKKGGSTGADSSQGVEVDSAGNVYITGYYPATITFGALAPLTTTGGEDVFFTKYNSAGTEQFAVRGTGSGNQRGLAIAIDISDNIYITGSFATSITFSPLTALTVVGNTDVFLVKYNTSGVPQWARRGGSIGADISFAIETTSSGDIYISGSFSNTITFGALPGLTSSGNTDVFLTKYNSLGTEQWNRKGGSTQADIGNGIASFGSDLYTTGQFGAANITFGSITLTNTSSNEAFLVKYGGASTVKIGGNNCTSVIVVSTTQITCNTPSSTSAGYGIVAVTNPDLTTGSLSPGFLYNLSLSLSIRNSLDTANFNVCDFGEVNSSFLATCSYRIKVSTNAQAGYSVFMQTSGGLNEGSYDISEAAIGSGGAGGSDISLATLGVEKYGVVINPGSTTGAGTITRPSAFNAGSTNSVKFNSLVATAILNSTGVNSPGLTDTVNTSLITHNLNIAEDTPAGSYSQTITYTVVANF